MGLLGFACLDLRGFVCVCLCLLVFACVCWCLRACAALVLACADLLKMPAGFVVSMLAWVCVFAYVVCVCLCVFVFVCVCLCLFVCLFVFVVCVCCATGLWCGLLCCFHQFALQASLKFQKAEYLLKSPPRGNQVDGLPRAAS